jgi:hypothetical protein
MSSVAAGQNYAYTQLQPGAGRINDAYRKQRVVTIVAAAVVAAMFCCPTAVLISSNREMMETQIAWGWQSWLTIVSLILGSAALILAIVDINLRHVRVMRFISTGILLAIFAGVTLLSILGAISVGVGASVTIPAGTHELFNEQKVQIISVHGIPISLVMMAAAGGMGLISSIVVLARRCYWP